MRLFLAVLVLSSLVGCRVPPAKMVPLDAPATQPSAQCGQ
jgi:hypothetical protein